MAPCLSMCLGGIGSGLTIESAKPLLEELRYHLLHFLCHKEKIRDLQGKLDDLNARRLDVERSVEEAKRRDDLIKEEVNKWLADVKKLIDEVKETEEELAAKKGCFKWINALYCCDRYKIGKQASEKGDDVSKLLEIGGQFQNGNVSIPRGPPSIEDTPMGDFTAFGSTKKARDEVLNALNDGSKHLIGIYGMGGVGKTTLMEHIGRKLKEDGTFDTVVKVVVSQKPKVDQVRREVADQLGLRIFNPSAGDLARRIKEEKKILIMLDDVWERLELKEVGIPSICKILLTSRKSQVCHAMEADVSVLVDVLSEEDSWSLFRSKAGSVVESSDVNPVAMKVAGECGGLPLALVVVGRALRGYEGRQEWEDALFQLKRATPTNLEDVEEKLFKSLELSYQHLKDDKVQKLFLYCCLFREDYDISEDALTRLVVGESLVDEIDESLEAVRSSVRNLVKKLKASCLVQDGGKMGCIRLHDVVRDVAVYIASRDKSFLVRAGLGMRYWPEVRENCTRISLSGNDIWAVPESPNCPQLVMLLLNMNPINNGLPSTFFDAMSALCVLDLSETGIRSLPSSITKLSKLTALCLNGCRELEDISLIGKLNTLKMLRLQKCGVKTLPEEIGNLVSLRQLDLSDPRYGSLIVPSYLLRNLFRLEELYMIGCRIVDGSILPEIASLQFLARLELFLDVNGSSACVIQDIAWNKLTQFFVYNLTHWSSLRTLYQKNLYLSNVSQLERWPKCLLTETEDLQLCECKFDWTAMVDEAKGFEKLKKLQITSCNKTSESCEQAPISNDMQYLLQIKALEQAPMPNAYRNLEFLRIVNMDNFVGICNGMLPTNSFRNLRTIQIENCQQVFDPVSVDFLERINHKLQDLFVNRLDKPEVILSLESFQHRPVLPNLRALRLYGLKKLLSIWRGICPPGSLQNLSRLDLHGCNSLEHLFSQKSESTHSHFLPLETFRSLKFLIVSRCGSLKYLFPRSIVNELRSLELLEVKVNAAMEEIVTDEENAPMEEGAFPALKDLSLVGLPNLTGFYQGEQRICFSWTSLRSLKLGGCSKLQRLPVGTDSAPQLRNVHLVGKANTEETWFRNLQWSDPMIPSRFTLISEANN